MSKNTCTRHCCAENVNKTTSFFFFFIMFILLLFFIWVALVPSPTAIAPLNFVPVRLKMGEIQIIVWICKSNLLYS